ncbi:PGPGW domain-containing protein [Streptomyces sp. NPDC094472]
MLPLPGPGWLVIFAGVSLWGIEFTWVSECWAGPGAGSRRPPGALWTPV